MRNTNEATLVIKRISSIQLMENAAIAFVKVFSKKFPQRDTAISIICGQGNNGGDGLAIARLLKKCQYKNVAVFLIKFSKKETKDYHINLKKVIEKKITVTTITQAEQIKVIKAEVIIDGSLGSG